MIFINIIMLIRLLIWIFQFALLIPKAYSFRTPKHDIFFYYKTHASVSLTNPKYHTTSYGIYVAGQTITIDIPTSVVAVSDILDWKVVNLNKDRLMFVHKKRPQIMINRKSFEQMKYSGELSDSIIPFGDNEALHVPTIFNPRLTKPVSNWNYIELLYFDDQSETVSVIRSLPWLKDDDWKYIKEWKMMDYIHFDDKLYLLIKRSIWNKKTSKTTQEISIIRLCLDKGSELLSSAVEVYFTRGLFEINKVLDLFFYFIPGTATVNERYQLHTTQLLPRGSKIYFVYFISDFVSLFEETANKCAFGSNEINLLQHHLRSEVGKCIKSFYKSCSTKGNIVPSRNISLDVFGNFLPTLDQFYHPRKALIHKFQSFQIPYPYFRTFLFMQTKPTFFTAICFNQEYNNNPITCNALSNVGSPSNYPHLAQADLHVNRHPFGFFYVNKGKGESTIFFDLEVCPTITVCSRCIMYGLYFNCIWSNSRCVSVNQPKNKKALTLNNCFKIIAFSPLILNSSPTKLTIQLDRPLHITAFQEHLVIQAGDNHCTDITVNGSSINCFMRLTKSGEFKIHVSLGNDRYADTSIISALSTDNVHISVPQPVRDYKLIIFILFSSLIINSLALIFYKKCYKGHLNKFKKVSRTSKVEQFVGTGSDVKFIKFFDSKKKNELSAITRVKAQIIPSKMDTLTDTTIKTKPSREQGSVRKTIRPSPRKMNPQKRLNSSKPKQSPKGSSKLF